MGNNFPLLLDIHIHISCNKPHFDPNIYSLLINSLLVLSDIFHYFVSSIQKRTQYIQYLINTRDSLFGKDSSYSCLNNIHYHKFYTKYNHHHNLNSLISYKQHMLRKINHSNLRIFNNSEHLFGTLCNANFDIQHTNC